MYPDKRRIFLAGATGLAGSGILKCLLEKHPSIRIKASWHKFTPFIKDKRITYVRGDLRDFNDCCRMLKGAGAAIMVAAQTGGSGSAMAHRYRQLNDNVVMSTQFFASCAAVGIKRVVNIVSATLYQPHGRPIAEDELDYNKDPELSHMGVGWAMRFTEKMCEFWHKKKGIEIILGRCANIYGPYDKFNPQSANFIPALIRKAVGKQDPFEVWGKPDVVRDVIYVDDFADAVIAMMNSVDIGFDVFNIGTGLPVRVKDVVRLALVSAGHAPSKIKYLVDRPSAAKYRVLDCSKAKRRLGWKANHTLEEGIRNTTRWWIENRRHWSR